MSNWQTYELLARGCPRLPNEAGVYAIYFGQQLVYIGSTCNLANRFSEHKIRYGYGATIITPWGDIPHDMPVRLKFKRSRRLGQWAMDEIRLIAHLQPAFNTQHKRRKRA